MSTTTSGRSPGARPDGARPPRRTAFRVEATAAARDASSVPSTTAASSASGNTIMARSWIRFSNASFSCRDGSVGEEASGCHGVSKSQNRAKGGANQDECVPFA